VNHGRMKYIRDMNRQEEDKKKRGERILRCSHTFIARAVNGRITMNQNESKNSEEATEDNQSCISLRSLFFSRNI